MDEFCPIEIDDLNPAVAVEMDEDEAASLLADEDFKVVTNKKPIKVKPKIQPNPQPQPKTQPKPQPLAKPLSPL